MQRRRFLTLFGIPIFFQIKRESPPKIKWEPNTPTPLPFPVSLGYHHKIELNKKLYGTWLGINRSISRRQNESK